MVPRLFWVPAPNSLSGLEERVGRATESRFSEPVALWLRLYSHDARQVIAFLSSIRARALEADLRLVVGMRVDLAIAAESDGVHLPAHGIDVADARRLTSGREMLIGASCHDRTELARARDADYVTVSPVFEVPGKGPALGRTGFRALADVARPRVIALGGISLERVPELVREGAHGVAVGRAIDAAEDPHESIERFLRAARGASTTIAPRGDTE